MLLGSEPERTGRGTWRAGGLVVLFALLTGCMIAPDTDRPAISGRWEVAMTDSCAKLAGFLAMADLFNINPAPGERDFRVDRQHLVLPPVGVGRVLVDPVDYDAPPDTGLAHQACDFAGRSVGGHHELQALPGVGSAVWRVLKTWAVPSASPYCLNTGGMHSPHVRLSHDSRGR